LYVLHSSQVPGEIYHRQNQRGSTLPRNAWGKTFALQILMGRAGGLGMIPYPRAPLCGFSVPSPFLGLSLSLFALDTAAQGIPLGWTEAFWALAAPLHPATGPPVAGNANGWRVDVQAIPTCSLACLVSGEADTVQFSVWGYALAWGKLNASSGKSGEKLLDDV
jgi:hypothetical protein